MYDQYHKAIDGITRHRTKKEFVLHITNIPINYSVESSLAVEYNALHQRFFLRLPLARTHESFTRSEEQYLHEQFFANVPAKIFFDLDLKRSMTEEEKDAFLAKFTRTLCKRLPVEMGTVASDVIVMESVHTRDVSTSFHIIVNNRYHLRDTRAVGTMLQTCFTKQKDGRTINILQDKFGGDFAVYGTDKSLRVIGGSKWADPRSMFVIRGLLPREVTYPQYVECFVQCVPAASTLFEIGASSQQQQQQQQQHQFGGVPMNVRGPFSGYIDRALEFIKRIPGNENATIESCTDSEARDRHFMVQFGFARTCHYLQYQDRPPNNRCISARIFPELQLIQLVCPQSCDCKALVREIGATVPPC